MPSMMELSEELGIAAMERNDYKEARKHFRYMVKESHKHSHADQAKALNRLGTCNTREGRYQDAAEAFRTAVELTERASGASHPFTANALNNLGFVIWKGFKDRKRAKPIFEQAVAILDAAMPFSPTEFPPNEVQLLAENYENLALLNEEERDYASAEKLRRQALQIKMDSIGDTGAPKSILTSLSALQTNLEKQGRGNEAHQILAELLPSPQAQ